jgi:hypothetical protein
MAEQLTQLDIYLLLELAVMQLPRFPDAMPQGFTYRLDVCARQMMRLSPPPRCPSYFR